MMRYLTIFSILIHVQLSAQLFGLQYRDQFSYVTALSYPQDSNLRVLSAGSKPGYYPLSKIFVYSDKLVLKDSIELLKGTLPYKNEPLKHGNRLYWPTFYSDTTNNTQGAIQAILELDTLYHFKALHKMAGIYNNYLSPVNITHLGNYFYAAYVRNFNTTVIYKLNAQFVALDSLTFSVGLADLYSFNNELVLSFFGTATYPCAGKGNSILKMLKVDTSLIIKNCFSFDSVGFYPGTNIVLPQRIDIIGNFAFSAKVIPITKAKLIAVGMNRHAFYPLPSRYLLVNSILDKNNQVLNTNTYGDTNTDYSYYEFSNFVAAKKNEVYTVGALGDGINAYNTKTKVFVTKSDTLGHVIWNREYGGDMYYRPCSIVFTPDGGCLIAGWRYDSTTMKAIGYANQKVCESFLLKLDVNGTVNSVHLFENGNIELASIKCFPNPASDKIIFDAPLHENIRVNLFDLGGRVVLKIENYKNFTPIDISEFSSGIYYYNVTSQNLNAFGKIIKASD